MVVVNLFNESVSNTDQIRHLVDSSADLETCDKQITYQ